MAEIRPSEGPAEAGEPAASKRRPGVGICLAALAGWLGGFEFLPDPTWLLGLAAPLACSPFLLPRSRGTTAALLTAVVLLAAAQASMTGRPPSSDHLARQLGGRRASIEVVGVVADQPVRYDGAYWRFPVRLEGALIASGWRTARGRVQVRMDARPDAPAPAYGQRWRLTGLVLPQMRRGSDPGFLMFVKSESRWLGTGPHSRFYAWCLAQRQRASAVLGLGLREGDFVQERALLRGLLLGERAGIEEGVRNAFARTGTLHIVAISGSHVAVFLTLIAAALRAVGVSRPRWAMYAAPFLVVYTAMAGLPPSAVRACIMAVVFTSAPLFRRNTDNVSSLALAALLILAFDPRNLFDAGFLLSFLVLGGLLAFQGPINRWLCRMLPDAGDGIEPAPVRARVREMLRAAFALVAATAAAWLVAEPLAALFFNLNSPVALVANLVVVPLAYLLLLSGSLALIAGLLFGSVFPLAAEVFNHASCLLARAMLGCIDRFAALPGAYQFVHTPPRGWIVVYFILLAAVFFGRSRVRRAALGTGLLLAAFWGLVHFLSQRATIEWMRPEAAPVVFLDLPRDADVLVNTGERFHAGDVVRMLHRRGVDRLRVLILTRPIADSLGAAETLLGEVPADEVWMSAWRGRSTVAARLAGWCETNRVPVRLLQAGDQGEFAGSIRWEVFHPADGATYRTASEGGNVIRFMRGPAAVLFAGGAGPACERELLRLPRDLDADVVLAGAGEKDAWSEELFRTVAPRAIVAPRPVAFVTGPATFAAAYPSAEPILPLRDQIWRMEFPGQGRLRPLKDLFRWSSGAWNRPAGEWWRGELVPAYE